jgi:hypothetical protein
MVPDCSGKRQRVLNHDRVAPNKCVFSNPAELMDARVRPKSRVVFDDHVAGKHRAIREDNVAADPAVMSNVRLSHDEVVIADFSDVAAAFGAPLQRRKLSKGVSFAGTQQAPLSAIFQILGRLSRGNKGIKDRPAPELRWAFDDAVTADSHIIVQDDVIADD